MTTLDRNPQHLPVPLGDTRPVRMLHRRRRHLVARCARAAAAGATAVVATAGVILLCMPATDAAYVDAAGVHVGGMLLRNIGTGPSGHGTVYQSSAATLVLTEPGGGAATATAAWQDRGGMRTASCTLHRDAGALIDECSFHTAATVLTSIDVLDLAGAGAWQRTYSDGVRVTIGTNPDGAIVPVPFPLGR